MNNFRNRLNKPRRKGESDQDYLERIFPTEEERILYWEILTKELYKKDSRAIVAALESLKETNPEAHDIMMDKYLKLEGDSN